ncbi:1-phosphatidylinositol 4,5-bisphosphate phosphodiesterase delta-1, partial [Coemansia sp. RSA 2322]
DLERIAEIRIGEQALWSVANEKSLPHGTTRLFAIVFYDQLVLKTICVVALSDESFYDWIDTLTYLVSSRKAVTTLAQFRRWRLICISRQWWEADQSRETATNSLRFVETLVQCSAPGVASGAALTLPQALQAIPVCSLPRAEKELVPIDYGSSLAPSSLPPLMASARKWLAGNGATYAPPILPVDTATPAMLSRAVEIVQQQQPAQQNVCSNEAAMELTEAVVFGHALQSVDALYHDIAFSFMPQQFFNGSSGDSNNNSISNEAEDEDDEESDQLTMAGSSSGGSNGKRVRGQRNHVPLRLEMPKSQPYGITQAVFARFLREVQKETTLSDAEVKRRFSAFTQGGREPMTAYDLEAYLFSDYNSVNPVNIDAEDDDGLVKCQGRRRADMDMPLNQYYVSTSHNTYLASDQIVGVASVECYVHALLRGCRCIELDCWDGRCGEPVVSHGHTFTTRILFEDIIIAVSQYAFAASPYPVILSFETHCSLAQQARMATILKKHLGAMLVVAPVGSSQEHELPSPNQLKHRIIVKNKVLEWSGCGSSSNSNSRPTSLTSNVASGAAAALGNSPGHSQAQGHGSTSKGVSPRSSVAQLKRKIAPELSELIVYCKAVHFEGLDDDSETAEAAFDQVTSVSESTSNQLIRQRGKQYIEYNAAQMTRVYPVFSRITSSNFNPIGHWAAGCQLVALNFQTHDRNMQLYEAMFQGTGDVGYVLKPRHLREVANRASGREIGNEGEGSSDNNNNNNNASAASSTSQSAVSLQSALSGRHSTVHINIISASNAVSTHGGARRSGRGLGTGEQRASFVVPDGGSNSISRTNTFHVRDRLSSSPRSLSRSPSDVAMFAGDDGEEGSGSMNQYFQQFPHDGAGYPSLNAAATAAMESLLIGGGAQMQLAQNSGGEQRHSNSNSAVRVEVEWISDGPVGGSPGSNSSMEEVAALASTIGQLQQAQLVAQSAATLGGLSTIASV